MSFLVDLVQQPGPGLLGLALGAGAWRDDLCQPQTLFGHGILSGVYADPDRAAGEDVDGSTLTPSRGGGLRHDDSAESLGSQMGSRTKIVSTFAQ
jgi:hypothetical protein